MSDNYKFNSLQIWRGLAAIMVLLAHAASLFKTLFGSSKLLTILYPGMSGVYFFFILSGFIILYTKQNYIGKSRNIFDYLIERATRIYPTYWAYLIITIIGLYALNNVLSQSYLAHNNQLKSVYDQLNLAGILKNMILYPSVAYPRETAVHWPILPIAWTLSYIVLFYISFILFILNYRLAISVYILWLACIILHYYNSLQSHVFIINFILNPEMICFFVGMLIAVLFLKLGHYLVKLYKPIFYIGFMSLFASYWMAYYNINIQFNSIVSIGYYCMSYAFIILGVILRERYDSEGIKHSTLRSVGIILGDASYSIYLIHFWTLTGLYFILKMMNCIIINEITTLSVVAVIATLIGILCHKLVERPLSWKLKRILLSDRSKMS